MTYIEQKELEDRYLMHTYGRKPVQLVRGEGMKVWGADGKEYLDFLSGIGTVSLGHCHPAVVEALQKQAATLMHVSNYYYIEKRAETARLLSELLNEGSSEEGEGVWKTFFANTGAEANECAIKLARLYAKKRVCAASEAQGASEDEKVAAVQAAPRIIVTLERSFHGRTLATLAATAQPSKQEAFQPLPAGFAATPINDVSALEKVFDEQGEQICAVMVECIQGESGVNPCTAEFLQAIRRLTEETGALMICDEVQCGIFRCGYPFAFQHFGIIPDVVTIAKGVASGMPTGMCCVRERVADAFSPGDHGTTFGGSCLAVAAAFATLSTLKEEGFAQKAEQKGAYLKKRLSELAHVREVRGLGLMLAAEFDEAVDAPDLVMKALEKGFLLNFTGPHTLRFLPPLICAEEQIDALVEMMGEILPSA